MSLQVVSTVRRDNVQFFTKDAFLHYFDLRGRLQVQIFTWGRVCMELFTYELMSEIIGLTHAKDWDVYSRWKNVPRRNFVTYMDLSTCKFSHERTCLYTTCPIMSYVWGSTDMFPRSVLTTRRVHVHVRTLTDGCVHTFLTYELMTMRKFKHITPCL